MDTSSDTLQERKTLSLRRSTDREHVRDKKRSRSRTPAQ